MAQSMLKDYLKPEKLKELSERSLSSPFPSLPPSRLSFLPPSPLSFAPTLALTGSLHGEQRGDQEDPV
eukprot:3312278-Rhodomonas_salina.1